MKVKVKFEAYSCGRKVREVIKIDCPNDYKNVIHYLDEIDKSNLMFEHDWDTIDDYYLYVPKLFWIG